jgi:hypothetical protein
VAGAVNRSSDECKRAGGTQLSLPAASACALLAAFVLSPEALAYSPEAGTDTLKTIAGAGYIVLVIFYFVRLFSKRAERAKTEVRCIHCIGSARSARSLSLNCAARLAAPMRPQVLQP